MVGLHEVDWLSDTALDGYATFSVCLLFHGWMDGCSVNIGGRGCGGGRAASPAAQTKRRRQFGLKRHGSNPTYQLFGASQINPMFFRATKLRCIFHPSFVLCVGGLASLMLFDCRVQ